MAAWQGRQELLSGRWIREQPDTDDSRHAEAEWARELGTLAYDVQHELGPDLEVLLRGRPLGERRG